MQSEKEIKLLLGKLDNVIERIQLLKTPPEAYKMENCHYRMLLSQQRLLSYILDVNSYEINEAYDAFADHLDIIEKDSDS